jgi:hypothetical protein
MAELCEVRKMEKTKKSEAEVKEKWWEERKSVTGGGK